MNHKIAYIFKSYLETLSWKDQVAGLVQTVHTFTPDQKSKSYPVSCDVTADACAKGDYLALTPDSSKKSVLYFEDGGCSMIEKAGNRLKFRSNLRLVGWLNFLKIAGVTCEADLRGCGTTGDYVIDVIKALPTSPISTADFVSIMVTNIDEAEHSSDIFSKYTYSEELVQYLLFPYGFFCLDLTINFTIPCTTENVD